MYDIGRTRSYVESEFRDRRIPAGTEGTVVEIYQNPEGYAIDFAIPCASMGGGYDVIASDLFPRLDVDVLLLEYDTDRAGDFAPLAYVRPSAVAVLGLLTTKTGALEPEAAIDARIAEASAVKPLAELALSPQCGFASVAVGNPVTPEEQRAKLELVGRVARRVWR